MTDDLEIHDNGAGFSRGSSEGMEANILTASGNLDVRRAQTELRLPGGQTLMVPTAFFFRGSEREVSQPTAGRTEAGTFDQPALIPIIEEQLRVEKRTVTTGKVLLQKHVDEYQEQLDVPLAVRTFDIERVVLNRPIETPPQIRQEGNTTVYPLVEEQLVITTQLILKEEVRVTKRDTERRDTRTVTLKRESLTVTRMPADLVGQGAGDGSR